LAQNKEQIERKLCRVHVAINNILILQCGSVPPDFSSSGAIALERNSMSLFYVRFARAKRDVCKKRAHGDNKSG
jgi:hypothetical protein